MGFSPIGGIGIRAGYRNQNPQRVCRFESYIGDIRGYSSTG